MKSSFDEFVRRFGKKKKNIPTVIKIYSKLSDVYTTKSLQYWCSEI